MLEKVCNSFTVSFIKKCSIVLADSCLQFLYSAEIVCCFPPEGALKHGETCDLSRCVAGSPVARCPMLR